MQCEVCGRQIMGKPHRVIIEGAKMITCEKCAELGTVTWEPEPMPKKQPSSLVLRNIPMRREIYVRIPENIEIIDGYGARLREAREKIGLSHEDLGRKIGEKVSVIKKLENEKMIPDQNLASKLGNVLRIKLFVPVIEPKTKVQSPPPKTEITIGEIVQLKTDKRRRAKNEDDLSSTQKAR